MSRYIILSSLIITLLLSACAKDDKPVINELQFDYKVEILHPNNDDKHMGDTVPIHIMFESQTSATVHHINVSIYNKLTETVVYSSPATAHIHATDGEYAFNDNLVLSEEYGFEANTVWILEAKVWGHEQGVEEVIEQLEFYVQP